MGALMPGLLLAPLPGRGRILGSGFRGGCRSSQRNLTIVC
ncbi:hypothetical protein STRTUCAR8_00830 [Streptomyces turgidiscabies Car8]|uniref:Uncharacterized protein n=1 Tax=Streptomyces turgidiscabies (strain Car8) TaxID=698760 RepID=L7EZF3_STRT8|nr:hypothetical protein STRTUCAR8_00830 [Streptomyces turgidiscabies Car8]